MHKPIITPSAGGEASEEAAALLAPMLDALPESEWANEQGVHRVVFVPESDPLGRRCATFVYVDSGIEPEGAEVEHGRIAWGSQIRSYIFVPYEMVVDHRTDERTTDLHGFLAGRRDIMEPAPKPETVARIHRIGLDAQAGQA